MSENDHCGHHEDPVAEAEKPSSYGDLYIEMISGLLTGARAIFLGLLFFYMFLAEYLGFGPLDWGQSMILASLFASGLAFGIAFVRISSRHIEGFDRG